MNRGITLIGGLGLGAGLMYLLDPERGRRRRTLLRDRLVSLGREAGNVPGLQGGGRRPGDRIDVLHPNWSPATRTLVSAAGGGLLALGVTQPFPFACVLGSAGLALMARALTNKELGRLLGVTGGRR